MKQSAPGQTNPEELDQLFQQHRKILESAANHAGFRYKMPQGGQEAIDAGLVTQSDSTWMMSDDPRASNGFTLTNLGRAVTENQGWVCECAAHQERARQGNTHITPAAGGMCRSCQASVQQYGETQWQGRSSCGTCAKALMRK